MTSRPVREFSSFSVGEEVRSQNDNRGRHRLPARERDTYPFTSTRVCGPDSVLAARRAAGCFREPALDVSGMMLDSGRPLRRTIACAGRGVIGMALTARAELVSIDAAKRRLHCTTTIVNQRTAKWSSTRVRLTKGLGDARIRTVGCVLRGGDGVLALPGAAQIFRRRAHAAPSVAPGASPGPTPRSGTIAVALMRIYVYFADTSGFGNLGLSEGANFANGTSAAAPNSPYDTFSAPMMPGNTSENALWCTDVLRYDAPDVSTTIGVGYVRGSTTLTPPIGRVAHADDQSTVRRCYSLPPLTQPGQDDGTAFAASILSGSILIKDGSVPARGWFDPAQTAASFSRSRPGQSAIPRWRFCRRVDRQRFPRRLWRRRYVYPLHGIDLTAATGRQRSVSGCGYHHCPVRAAHAYGRSSSTTLRGRALPSCRT